MKVATSHQSVSQKEQRWSQQGQSLPKKNGMGFYLKAKFRSDYDYVLELTGVS
jgi:hypothetical protein